MTALPDDCGGYRLPCRAIPEHRRLPLVGDPDRSNLIDWDTRLGNHLSGHPERGVPDFGGIVIDPALPVGKCWVISCCTTPTDVPWRSNSIARLDVVPWSIARINCPSVNW